MPLGLSNTAGAAVLIVLSCTLVSVAGFLAVVRWFPRLRSKEHNEVAGAYLGLLAALYGLLLAFVTVSVYTDFVDADSTTHSEITRVSNLMRAAEAFDDHDRLRIQGALLQYSRDVVDHEWATMADGDASPVAAASYARVWDVYRSLTPSDDREQTFYDLSIGRLAELAEARRLRLIESDAVLPPPLWILLITGAILSVGYGYTLHTEDVRMQAGSIGMTGFFLGLVLFIVFAFQHPFAGDVAVSREPFRELIADYADRAR